MRQMTLAQQASFERYAKKTRRERFLEEKDAVMPWAELLALVAPHYSKGETGRKPVGLSILLRVYFLQQWFSLSDPAAEDADVDSKEGIVHSVCSTAASVSDVHMLPDLLHGEEKKVWGDAGYQGQTEAIRQAAPKAQDMTSRRVKTRAGVDETEKRRNRTKARVRSKVEWSFRILKRIFGFTRVRYRGLKKNHEWLACPAICTREIVRVAQRLKGLVFLYQV